MRRHTSLTPLTHDHHHALAQARRLRSSSKLEQSEWPQVTQEFLSFFDSDTLAHFKEEEDIIFPLVVGDPQAGPLVAQALEEHVRIKALVERLRDELHGGSPTLQTMVAVADLLQEHIRLEEKELFPLIEQVAQRDLSAIELAPRVRNQVRVPNESSLTEEANDAR